MRNGRGEALIKDEEALEIYRRDVLPAHRGFRWKKNADFTSALPLDWWTEFFSARVQSDSARYYQSRQLEVIDTWTTRVDRVCHRCRSPDGATSSRS